MTELQVTINDLLLINSVNIAEINLLKKEVAQNKALTDSKLKNLEARLILAQHSLKSGTSGGGGFPSFAQQELVTTQMKTLELMNTLAQSPLAPSALNIETYQLGTGNPFPNLFNQILPQIPLNNLEITPLQFETIQNNIGETIADKFQEIGIETMKGDIVEVKNNTTPEKQKQNVKEGVCEQTQPDKCLDKNIKQPLEEKMNQVQNNINVNILGIPNLFGDECSETLAKVTELQESLEKAWNSTTEDKKINALNNIILLHNAMLLSQDINKTIPKVQNFALQNIEVTDYLENPIDIGSEMTQTLTPFPDSISDLENIHSLQSTLVNHNQTIQSNYGAIFAVQNTKVSLLQGLKTLGNYTATIGNLMQLQGSLESNSFPWMWENFYLEPAVKGLVGKYAISSQIIDDVSSLAIRGLPVIEEANEAIAGNQEFVSLDAKIEQLKADYHQERDQLETTEAEASLSPEIDRLDLIQLEPEEYGA